MKRHTSHKEIHDLKINLINVFSDDDLLRKICYLSEIKNIIFYDATFIAIAEKYETKLITADDYLYESLYYKDFKLLYLQTDLYAGCGCKIG